MYAHNKTRRRFLRQLSAFFALSLTSFTHIRVALAKTLDKGLDQIIGRIVRKGESGYSSWWASMTWYIFKPKRYPELIIQAKNEADVIQTINYARNNGMPVTVRSTGHNPAKAVIRNEGILLDLSRFRSVDIDTETQTAWIGPGLRSEELLKLTSEQGLAFPAAHTGIVGLGGYLLGGGLGWNMPEWGLACRSVLAAELVTADGEKRIVSENENQDLLWALRGVGPGFFAAVTRYKLRLYPLHATMRLNRYVIPIENITEAISSFAQISKVKSNRLEIFIKVGRFYPENKPYTERQLVCTVGFFAFADTEEDACRVMQPVTDSSIAEMSIVKKENIPLTYDDLYVPPATDYSSPNRSAVQNIWTDELAKGMHLLVDKMINDPPSSPRSFILSAFGFNPTKHDPGICVRTDASDYLSWYMIAEQEEHIAANYKWMKESLELVDPITKGRYINEIDPLQYPQHVQDCFSKQAWQRLKELRHKYDPNKVFHTYLGHN